MKPKNNLLRSTVIILLLIGSLAVPAIKKHFTQQNHTSKITIGILQTASHPALDNAREGFIQELKQKLGDSIAFIIQNGQGSIAQLHTIAKSFHENSNIDGIFAIATPALQTVASIEKIKPIFISAVTNPAALGLLTPDRNICGSSDTINIRDQIELITSLLPEVKTVGILFNTGEVNSVGLVKEMQHALKQLNILVHEIGVTNDAEIPMALATAVSKIDLLWAPTDNTVASAVSFIAQKMREHKKPFIVSDNLLVEKGALAAAGVDYIESGKQAAHAAISVFIDHKKPAELEITKPVIEQVVVNKEILNELNLTIPPTLKDKVIFVNNHKGHS